MGRRYELFIDELPVWGFVGPPPEETKDDDNIYVYTHKAFDVDYNDNRVRFSYALKPKTLTPTGLRRGMELQQGGILGYVLNPLNPKAVCPST